AVQVKSASVSDSVSAMASASTQSPESEDSDDDNDDDDDDTEESETEESESSESGEASTVSTATESPVIVTDDVTTATIVENITPDPIDPTIVTDDTADSGRGDSLGSYPSEYKSIVYVEDKSYHKVPEPHKSWDYTSKKSTYEPEYGNEVHKAFKVYKGVQVHQELLEGDTSTPEVESQDLSPRQASLDTEVSQSSSSDTDSISSDSTSTHEESASTSDESPEGESLSQSSEEATPTPGAADSQSDESKESQSEEDAQQPEITTDLPMVVTAK
uniref:Secreted phosphoprotein 1 n=1 Tax=Periophthalmus magnuspinnatus TaxID=409849 RepID=A0A3B4ARF3_9GOBI